jgi:hypothetical protein
MMALEQLGDRCTYVAVVRDDGVRYLAPRRFPSVEAVNDAVEQPRELGDRSLAVTRVARRRGEPRFEA